MLKLSNNKRFFLNIFSMAMIVYGLLAVPPAAAAAIAGETTPLVPLIIAGFACTVTGAVLRHFIDTENIRVRPRMNYLTTTMVWLIVIAITAAVYFFGLPKPGIVDSIFESAASLTTTGASTFDSAALPVSMKLWRSELNWLGGIGIILIAASCLDSWGFSGYSLVSVEIPGSEFLRSSADFRHTCRTIIRIYLGMTALHFILLIIAGMEPLTSVMTSLSNVSTSGLQHIHRGDITGLNLPIRIIITFFAFFSSVNVSIFILIFRRKFNAIRQSTEIKHYAARIIISAALISVFLTISNGGSLPANFGNSLMQTISCFSTSGYVVADCNNWPLICQLIILLQMFFGACAVSTSGGIKMARVEIAIRTVTFGLFRHIHPRAVRPVRFNRKAVSSEQLVSSNLFVALFMLTFLAGALLLSLDSKNESILDALNYSQAMLTNTGTTIGDFKAYILPEYFSPFSRIVMSVEMLAGRLEIYPVLMIFFRNFWKDNNF